MNKDQVKGRAKVAEGRTRKAAGDLTGNREQKAKGRIKEAEGKAQKNLGDAKRNIAKKIERL